MVEVNKKSNEQNPSVVFRFIKKVKQSGVLRESKKKRYHQRASNRRTRRISAAYRSQKTADIEKQRKLGLI
ncbi:30S ribosomal protein S21 [Patescibacteria group bacterium]|nr:30S ribosomal protein S21 [Patescibacteria group bacterium]MCL5733332.1 30S ribosomal protein S21 [Patescibacteria group bacterium]